jgi:hypothetical protein
MTDAAETAHAPVVIIAKITHVDRVMEFQIAIVDTQAQQITEAVQFTNASVLAIPVVRAIIQLL